MSKAEEEWADKEFERFHGRPPPGSAAAALAARRAKADAEIGPRYARPLGPPVPRVADPGTRKLISEVRELVAQLSKPSTRTVTIEQPSGRFTATIRSTRNLPTKATHHVRYD
jgi:hypothetical protein